MKTTSSYHVLSFVGKITSVKKHLSILPLGLVTNEFIRINYPVTLLLIYVAIFIGKQS